MYEVQNVKPWKSAEKHLTSKYLILINMNINEY